MRTVADNITQLAETLREKIAILLERSSIYRWNEPDSMIILVGGNYGWEGLDKSGRQAQGAALKTYEHLFAIVTELLRNRPQNVSEILASNDAAIRSLLQQRDATRIETTEKAKQSLHDSIRNIINLVDELQDNSDNYPLYLPDTNALLLNPDIEKWRFPDTPRFVIGLLPTVLAELDSLKVAKSETVKNKAEGLIRRVKGYRSRGKLNEGVPLTSGISTLITFALEPNFNQTLSWLDKDCNDDRILASMLEVMRLYAHTPVTLVTRDINLQNKAEYALFPFVEPPDSP